MGVKFFRQHPLIYENDRGKLHFFIPDFYTAEKKLVIELDGKIHQFQKYYDQERDLIIESLDLKVLRFENEETFEMDRCLQGYVVISNNSSPFGFISRMTHPLSPSLQAKKGDFVINLGFETQFRFINQFQSPPSLSNREGDRG